EMFQNLAGAFQRWTVERMRSLSAGENVGANAFHEFRTAVILCARLWRVGHFGCVEGIRPILGRVALFFAASGSDRREKIESREKLKMSAKFQKFRGRFKTVARKFKSSAERWAFRRKFETAAEQLKSCAEKF